MKKTLCVLMIVIFAVINITGTAEGLLPQLDDVYGTGMPSLADVLFRAPDTTEENADGSSMLVYTDVQDAHYTAYGELLGKAGCTLQGYTSDESSISCEIEKNGKTFTFSYDIKSHKAEFHFPAGTYDEPLKSPRPQSVGESVFFGWYEQDNNLKNGLEPIEWIVMDLQEDKALLLSKYALDSLPYQNTIRNQNTVITWENCSLRKWLNETFLKHAFSEEQQKAIMLSNISNIEESNGNNTKDSVFLFSNSDVNKYFRSDPSRICEPTAFATAQGGYTNNGKCWWWLRSKRDGQYFHLIDLTGAIGKNHASTVTGCMRPAIWISFESELSGFYLEANTEQVKNLPKPTLWPNLSTSKPSTKPKSNVPARLLNAKYVLGTNTSEVLEIKKKMQTLGYFSAGAELTGNYNSLMQERIRMFQKDHGLKQTGLIDKTFLEALYAK